MSGGRIAELQFGIKDEATNEKLKALLTDLSSQDRDRAMAYVLIMSEWCRDPAGATAVAIVGTVMQEAMQRSEG